METTAETLINITERAGERIASLLRERGAEDGILRVFVAGGGCSGYQYGMEIVEAEAPNDAVLRVRELTLVVDPESAPLLHGAEIDFVEDVMRSGFTITNPNAAAPSCSCGARAAGEQPSCC